MRDSDEGREAGPRRQVREARNGYRLARSPDRDADATHQRADGAPALAPQGPLLSPRAAEARRASAAVPELPAEEGPRGLSRPHQGARLAPLAPTIEGWKFERALRPGLTRAFHPSRAQWRNRENEHRRIRASARDARHGLGRDRRQGNL